MLKESVPKSELVAFLIPALNHRPIISVLSLIPVKLTSQSPAEYIPQEMTAQTWSHLHWTAPKGPRL